MPAVITLGTQNMKVWHIYPHEVPEKALSGDNIAWIFFITIH